MTADRSAATHEEFAARVAPFDAAPAAEESAVERVARAIARLHAESRSFSRPSYAEIAAAALDAMRPAPDAPRADVSVAQDGATGAHGEAGGDGGASDGELCHCGFIDTPHIHDGPMQWECK
jgi:hypothetical protein